MTPTWTKARARMLGMSIKAYTARLESGDRWCSACKAWHPRDAFGRDASGPGGVARKCLRSEAARRRAERRRKKEPAELQRAQTPMDALDKVYDLARAKAPHQEIVNTIREFMGW